LRLPSSVNRSHFLIHFSKSTSISGNVGDLSTVSWQISFAPIRGMSAHLRDTRQGRAEFGKDRFPGRSNIRMERIKLFQSTSLHRPFTCHRPSVPSVIPPTQNYGKLLFYQICLISGRSLLTITSLGQSNSLPPLQVASTSKQRKLLIGCLPHFLAEIGGGISSGWVSTAAVSIYRDRERKFTQRLCH